MLFSMKLINSYFKSNKKTNSNKILNKFLFMIEIRRTINSKAWFKENAQIIYKSIYKVIYNKDNKRYNIQLTVIEQEYQL